MANTVNYHVKERFEDFHNSEQELIKEVVEKNPYMTWSILTFNDVLPEKYRKKKALKECNIEVEHSAIDFQKVIVGEKIRYIQEKDYRHVNFNDNHLASIFWVEDEEHIDFYNLEAVRKIIDFQFVRTRNFL